MKYKLFRKEFEADLQTGAKDQSLRPNPSHPRYRPVVGEVYGLRVWSGMAYRSKQRLVAVGRITEVLQVYLGGVVDDVSLVVEGQPLGPVARDEFARRDGFPDFAALQAWLRENDVRLPFEGYAMRWELC